MSLDRAKQLSVSELTSLSGMELMSLQEEAKEAVDHAQKLKQSIDGAIAIKYSDLEKSQRHQQGKEMGSVQFVDQNIRVVADLPKKVQWDQAALSAISNRIQKSGDDPTEFIEITYKISESKFNAWPDHLKSVFSGARTLGTGKPKHTLKLNQ